MRFLLTGHDGFIGTHLMERLTLDGNEVIPFDGDIRTHREWNLDVDCVVHLAALVGRAKGEEDPQMTAWTNAIGTLNLAQACGRAGVRMVYASTSEVYGDLGEDTATEDGKMVLPHNIYGLTKRWGEEACQMYAPDDLVIWRISMPYGPGLAPGSRAAVTVFLDHARKRETFIVHRGAKRNLCFISDLIRAMTWTINRPGIWNLGVHNKEVSMRYAAELACELTGAPKSLIYVTDPPLKQTIVKRLDMSKLYSLGWVPLIDLREGMEVTLDWLNEKYDAADVVSNEGSISA